MDAVFIKALTQQALTAYTTGGEPALAKWKADLPAPHLAEFERFCAEPLREAIEALGPLMGEPGEVKERTDDPRKVGPVGNRKVNPL